MVKNYNLIENAMYCLFKTTERIISRLYIFNSFANSIYPISFKIESVGYLN